jgi:hypothetical protein
MSLPIAPLETIAAEGLTGLFISAGAKGDATKIVARANGVLAIISAITQINNGNTVTGLTGLSSVLTSASLDPGEALALQGLITVIANQAALINTVVGGTVLGTVLSAVYINISNGITSAANAELTKYGPVAAQAAAAAAPKVA